MSNCRQPGFVSGSSRRPRRHLEPPAHFGTWGEACSLECRPSIPKNHKHRDALNAIARGQLRIGFGIDLQHHGLACHFARQRLDLWRRHATWSAPRCPKVHENRNARFADDVVKGRCIHRQRFCQWRQGSFAGAATSGVSQMPGRYTVLRAAGRTHADGRIAHGRGESEQLDYQVMVLEGSVADTVI
jgi:hypothetical protein